MKRIPLTTGGPQTSAIGLGCNNFGLNPYGSFTPYEKCKAVVDAAFDAGYTYFDTAEGYGKGESEEFLGRALESRRDEVLIATKFGANAAMPEAPEASKGSAEYIRWAIDGSLRRLRTDCIDVYQMHQPDPGTPITETLGVLDELRAAGKIRFFGVGGCSSEQLEALADVAGSGGHLFPISSMTYYSLLTRRYERDVIPTCVQLGIRVHPWFVLESGLLSGKFTRVARTSEGSRANAIAGAVRDEVWDVVEQLQGFADGRAISMVELAIGGIAAMPAVGVVIVGASTAEQVAVNAAALDWVPSDSEIAELQSFRWASPNEKLN